MATPAAPRSTAPGPASTASADWTVQVADTIESVVGSIRNKTTVPLETIARALVYGIIVATLGVAALVLVTILAVRVIDYVLPVWAAYAILGGFFTLVGLLLWRKRRPSNTQNGK